MKTDKDIIAIGDVHGITLWKEIVRRHPDSKFVFLGDYCDPYQPIGNEEVLANFKQIIQFKREHWDDVVLLLGNHDMHYITDKAPIGSRFSLDLMMDIEELLEVNEDCFQCVFCHDDMLFTHAGVSLPWFKEQFGGNVNEGIADQLMARLDDTSLYDCGKSRGGKHAHGGIFWADMAEMHNLPPNITQIVGHTRTPEIICRHEEESTICFCDTLCQGKYLQIEYRDGIRRFYQLTLNGDKLCLGE
ncbi:MAG: metallophosphoesterase [Bacteroidaceae bacterium]|nr:metallophosphoesterase [Bacteroidaceae bacterium]